MFGRCSSRIAASATTIPPASIPRRSLFTAPTFSPAQSSNATKRTRLTHKPIPCLSNQTRCIAFSSKLRRGYRMAGRDIWRKNPIVLPVAILSVVGAGAFFIYAFYFQTMEINTRMSRFPQPVAKELRKALYFTEVNMEPQKAIEHYRAALRLSHELGMHPYSDEVIGIKLQAADMYVRAGFHKQAVHLLSRTASEAMQWVNRSRRRLSAGTPGKELSKNSEPNIQEIFGPPVEDYEMEYELTTRVIKKLIGIYLLTADILEDEHLKDPFEAFASRRAALSTLAQEIKNREQRGLPPTATPEEGDSWVSAEEASHTMSDVGSTWLRAGRPEKALELLMPAVAILRQVEGRDITCRQVVLLSNIAAAMFDHRHSEEDVAAKKIPQNSVEKQMKSSRDWALKALEVSNLVKEDYRDDECDMGCAAAADVLSAIAEWQGADEEARKWLLEEKRYCESAQFAEGIQKVSQILGENEKYFHQRGNTRPEP
ncbi:hypothetical protein PISL3812_04443 [Talaromyces islandicus]|uniref:TPR domain protein n=1 Tax=Talaromyces islandicus TaxID=28573 RepID=A0A0U1LX87_TALIS|nr:hypothetical protein PISL3812_04443 [Talaromyces islandicus]